MFLHVMQKCLLHTLKSIFSASGAALGGDSHERQRSGGREQRPADDALPGDQRARPHGREHGLTTNRAPHLRSMKKGSGLSGAGSAGLTGREGCRGARSAVSWVEPRPVNLPRSSSPQGRSCLGFSLGFGFRSWPCLWVLDEPVH